MALDLKEIRKVVIDSIKAAIGSDLAQSYNPALDVTTGIVMNARPNPDKAIPDYPYAVLDVTNIKDDDWHVTNVSYDSNTDIHQYETHKQIDMQISIYGGDATSIASKLATAYRRDDVLEILALGAVGLKDVQQTQILPELLQTDFLEVSFVQLTIRVNDIFVDPLLESIEDVILDGELEESILGAPIDINIDTTT